MIEVKFPEPSFRFKKENGVEYIFDGLRKSWLVLNEEEWVRQNFVQYLVSTLGYPGSFIALEKEIAVGELTKRFDILVYDNRHQPWLMVECKARTILLDNSVVNQLLRYHSSIQVPFLVITNGHYTFAWEKRDLRFELINTMPAWQR
jgi:hypothetical protein